MRAHTRVPTRTRAHTQNTQVRRERPVLRTLPRACVAAEPSHAQQKSAPHIATDIVHKAPHTKGEATTCVSIATFEDVAAAVASGEQRRHYEKTNMNERSSRSHTIVHFMLESTTKPQRAATPASEC
jgi:hypothetical protein